MKNLLSNLPQKTAGLMLLAYMTGAAMAGALAQGKNENDPGARGHQGLKVVVNPSNIVVAVSEEVQFEAYILDRDGTRIDTVFTWSVDGEFGSIDTQTGLFTALARGRGFVLAVAGDLSGKARINVRWDTTNQERAGGSRMLIMPEDTVIVVGDQVEYEAFIVDSSGAFIDTADVDWELKGRNVGILDENGLFTATNRGIGIIKAGEQGYAAMTKVIVTTSEHLASEDSVRFRFKHRDGDQIGNIRRQGENDILKISGLPFPLNVLNGGEIVFPPGCLDENIFIDISISDLAQVSTEDSTVTYAARILNGISFDVYVDGELRNPYYFEEPVGLILPFKQSLIEQLGLSVDDLWMFFYSDSADFDGDGITNVVVDSTKNKIYAEVIHFSTLLVADKSYWTSTGIQSQSIQPHACRLYANYPNPFNPETFIRFDLAMNERQEVSVIIYNLMGQKVRTLVQGSFSPGVHTVAWDGKDDDGLPLGSGMYIYQLKTGSICQTRQMVLIR